MTQIECQEARLRRIEAMNSPGKASECNNHAASDPEVHHFIGKTQNFSEHISPLLEKNQGDPAFKVRTLSCLMSCLVALLTESSQGFHTEAQAASPAMH